MRHSVAANADSPCSRSGSDDLGVVLTDDTRASGGQVKVPPSTPRRGGERRRVSHRARCGHAAIAPTLRCGAAPHSGYLERAAGAIQFAHDRGNEDGRSGRSRWENLMPVRPTVVLLEAAAAGRMRVGVTDRYAD